MHKINEDAGSRELKVECGIIENCQIKALTNIRPVTYATLIKSILVIYISRVHIYDITNTDRISSGHTTTILVILKWAGKGIRKSLS